MKKVLITLCTLTFASSFALADSVQTPGDTSGSTSNSSPRFDVSFEQIDADGNGVSSREEAAAAGIEGEGFDQLDKDGNGELSREELLGVSGNEGQSPGNYNPGSSGMDVDGGTQHQGGNAGDAPGNYNPGNSEGREVDRATEHQRSNETNPADRSVQ